MIALRLDEIAAIVGGEVHDASGELVVGGPAFLDSRDPAPGGLFAAFVGDNTDGHDYAEQAVAGGAAAVLGSRATGVPSVVVPDVESALQELARVVLRRLRDAGPLEVIALTGSQGKTSTKDLLVRVLTDRAPTIGTLGSFNNELGLPLTVLRAGTDTRYLVLEMGARGIGHLEKLTAIAPPDVSVVLNVGSAHIGEFGSQDNIAIAKGELVEALTTDGIAVLNADDPRVSAMRTRTQGQVVTFGRSEEADVRLGEVHTDELGRAGFTLSTGTGIGPVSLEVQLQLLGVHQALNAAAVAATATAIGIGLEQVVTSLASVTALSRWRMEIHERDDGLVVINDAYNANPDSMRAALETLADIGARSGRRTVAVLGEMRELGHVSREAHAEVGRLLDTLAISETVVVGAEAAAIRGRTTRPVASVDDAVAWLRQNVHCTDVVLVKASRGARLERVAEALLDVGRRPEGGTAR